MKFNHFKNFTFRMVTAPNIKYSSRRLHGCVKLWATCSPLHLLQGFVNKIPVLKNHTFLFVQFNILKMYACVNSSLPSGFLTKIVYAFYMPHQSHSLSLIILMLWHLVKNTNYESRAVSSGLLLLLSLGTKHYLSTVIRHCQPQLYSLSLL